MDFDAILEKWENRRDRGKSPKPPSIEGAANWLDRYPPGAEMVREREEGEKKPVSGGRSIWLRRPHQDTLDLHGFNSREAQHEMDLFFQSMRRRGLRKGLIIHGKGLRSPKGPVLTHTVKKHLEKSVEIGVFGRAARRDGGSGATWFVLRQRSL